MLQKYSISTTTSTVSVALQLFMEDIEKTKIWQPNLNANWQAWEHKISRKLGATS